MKLLWCDKCHDVVCLHLKMWRQCACGSIGGQYNEDTVTATIAGEGVRVFGIANPFFDPAFESWSELELDQIRKEWGYKDKEIWWGQHLGDWQLLEIESTSGPRLSHEDVLFKIFAIVSDHPCDQPYLEIVKELNDRRQALIDAEGDWKKFKENLERLGLL